MWSYETFYRRGSPAVQQFLQGSRGLGRILLRELAGVRSFRKGLQYTETMSAIELGQWQTRIVRSTIEHAWRHVPYYARRAQASSPGSDAAGLLSGMPLLNKSDVIEAGNDMLARNILIRFPSGTSGSTGSPMKLYRSAGSIGFEQALIERQLEWAGWSRGQRRVWLRGDVIVPLEQTTGPFWRVNSPARMLMCSSFHLNEHTALEYLRAIERYNPAVIQAYPSSIGLLARWMVANGERYTGTALRGIVTSSERLSNGCRQDCRRAFGVGVFDWYGQAERVGAIGTCEHGNYHIIEDAGYLELLPHGDGSSLLVGTTFENRAMPLIRYVTGDCVVPADSNYACPCGRAFRVIDSVIGREADTVVTSDGRQHVLLDFIFDYIHAMKHGQIVLEAPDRIVINVVLHQGAAAGPVRDLVMARARERLGPSVDISFNQVSDIPRTSSGKFKVVVNQLAQRR
jgi:phenylacetate-CoA ligase